MDGPYELHEPDQLFESRLLPELTVRRIHYFPRAHSAVRFVEEHFGEPIRLDDVARSVSMTPTAFSRYFTEKVGIAFSAIVKTIRIERTIEKLSKRDCSIASLAYLAGYESPGAFSRAFRDIVGKSPSAYRNELLARGIAEK